MISPDSALRQRDPGLQAERTALAWNRTGLAVFANGLLALRSGWTNHQTPVTLLAFMLFLASAAVFLYALCRRRQLLSGQSVTGPPALAIAAVTIVSLAACVIGLVSIAVRL